MRDEQRGGPVGAQRFDDGAGGVQAEPRVQGGERLVEQHQGRPRGQGPRQRHALLLAAGELMGEPAGQARVQPDEVEQLGGTPGGSAFGAGQAEPDVGRDVHMREQGTFLRDVPDPPPLGGNAATGAEHPFGAEVDRPAVRVAESRHQP